MTGVPQTLSPAITAVVQFLEKSVVFGMFGGTSAALVSKKKDSLGIEGTS